MEAIACLNMGKCDRLDRGERQSYCLLANYLQLCFFRDGVQMSIHLFNITLESVLCLRSFEFHSTAGSERLEYITKANSMAYVGVIRSFSTPNISGNK